MIKRILVALSGGPFMDSEISHAIEIATANDATVTGVTLTNLEQAGDVGPVPVGGGAAADELAEHRQSDMLEAVEKSIDRFEAACGEVGLEHTVVREDDDTFASFIDLWRYHDVTVVGLRGLFEYGIIHNPDDITIRLIGQGVRPILAVANEHRTVKRAFVAYNGSMESAKAMKSFAQMQLWGEGLDVQVACFGGEAAAARHVLEPAGEYLTAHGFDVDTAHFEDDPLTGILARSEAWSADLIVMGSASRGFLSKFVMGDTAKKTLRSAKIPVYLHR